MNAGHLTHDELSDALRRTPNLTPTGLAARQLLTDHGYWLRQAKFTSSAVELEVWAGVIYARIGWPGALALARDDTAEPRNVAVLRLACHLSGVFTDTPAPWSLRDTLAAIHWDDATTVMAAIGTALTGERV